MNITVKQYVDLNRFSKDMGNDLLRNTSWDALRLDTCQGNPFFLHAHANEWQAAALKNEVLKARARIVGEYIQSHGYESVVSLGVGAAHFECNLKTAFPHLKIYCSDYAPKTVEVLRHVFMQAQTIEVFDMLKGPWVAKPGRVLYLLHRVDTEFNDEQWRVIFGHMHRAGICDILFIPNMFLDFQEYVKKTIKPLLCRVLGKSLVFAGYVRTQGVFRFLIAPYYEIDRQVTFYDLQGLVLRIKK